MKEQKSKKPQSMFSCTLHISSFNFFRGTLEVSADGATASFSGRHPIKLLVTCKKELSLARDVSDVSLCSVTGTATGIRVKTFSGEDWVLGGFVLRRMEAFSVLKIMSDRTRPMGPSAVPPPRPGEMGENDDNDDSDNPGQGIKKWEGTAVAEASSASLARSLAKVNEARATGARTAVTLEEQSEQMRRIDRSLDTMDAGLKRADRVVSDPNGAPPASEVSTASKSESPAPRRVSLSNTLDIPVLHQTDGQRHTFHARALRFFGPAEPRCELVKLRGMPDDAGDVAADVKFSFDVTEDLTEITISNNVSAEFVFGRTTAAHLPNLVLNTPHLKRVLEEIFFRCKSRVPALARCQGVTLSLRLPGKQPAAKAKAKGGRGLFSGDRLLSSSSPGVNAEELKEAELAFEQRRAAKIDKSNDKALAAIEDGVNSLLPVAESIGQSLDDQLAMLLAMESKIDHQISDVKSLNQKVDKKIKENY
jgi:hypothetical protein